ncbi:MAG TPA: hypothetical protein VNL71_22595 [Chloroflexota bacterium]|nr:hypothetical protein [Chloroflexota bacterium]
MERESRRLLPLSARPSPSGTRSHVLAVVGGPLDAAVIDLALVLAQEGQRPLDLLVLLEVPPLFPLRAYGDYLAARGGEAALDAAEEQCGRVSGESGALICRSAGAALVAEILARGSTDLIMGAPGGNWWRRWCMRRAIARVQARTRCRVYVVHQSPPPETRELPKRIVG